MKTLRRLARENKPTFLLPLSRLHAVSRWLQSISQPSLIPATRGLGPVFVAFAFGSVAHAQGTMDFSGAQTLMSTFKTFAMYAGAVICLGGLIFAGIRMMSGRFSEAIP